MGPLFHSRRGVFLFRQGAFVGMVLKGSTLSVDVARYYFDIARGWVGWDGGSESIPPCFVLVFFVVLGHIFVFLPSGSSVLVFLFVRSRCIVFCPF